ncbi:hypothetical protein IMSAGC012_02762 [Lachnospiraceae bacterium]|jgi:hypothetical protein|nr:DUF5067 domain-containing protein [Eubacterium sp.]GFI27634.1 hypothetical protein IMSAGC012_02762 [Lachnospiraceae bacterium]
MRTNNTIVKWKWIAAVFFAISMTGAIVGCGGEDAVKDVTNDKQAESGNSETKIDDSEESEPEDTDSEEKTEFYMGETAEQGDVQFTLVNVYESSGSELITPDDGNIFLVCEFDISNNSEEDIGISSVMNFEAYCDDYSLTLDIMGLQVPEAEGKSQLDGNIASGKKMNGIVAYQVPSDYKTMEINVTPDFWSGKDIKFIYSK